MESLLKLALTLKLLVLTVFGFQNKFKIIPDDCSVQYIDPKYMEATFGVLKINQENAVYGQFTMKVDLPIDTKVYVKIFKRFDSGNHSLPVGQFDKTLRNLLEMELFDFQSLVVRNARPPIIWPIEKNVIYRVPGWIPDSTKYPPNLPEGKFSAQISAEFSNKTKFVVVNGFFHITYNKSQH